MVCGTYLTGAQRAQAAAHLKESGFPSEDVSEPIPSETGFLLTVQCDSPVSVTRAENLLRQTGAQDVASQTQSVALKAGGSE